MPNIPTEPIPSSDPPPPSDDPPCPPQAEIHCLAAVSHELRTALNVILGLADLLQQTDDLQKARRQASMIHDSGLVMHALLDDMLEYSLLASGAARPRPEPFSPEMLLAELYDTFAIQARAAGSDFLTPPPATLPERLHGDALHARHALARLLELALKLAPRGEIHADFHFTPIKAQTSLLRGTIRASGCLLNELQCKSLFKPLRAHADALPRLPNPPGFGPAIARAWIRLLGGTLKVRCTPSELSTFNFEIPFSQHHH
ncbi:Autoinducer 2 sensor kinase/phosphatase LuxQ [Candidatus Magnetaquicoccaceae bacterium FCR-1]|uniref:histidine kinase n=1 Tax=Candidatus Magnetaquiglobus chichijimensis TaxID=3141448 RepID=A0ABQ0C5A9_9PROT